LFQGERATGYGPALMNTLFGQKSSSKMLQSIAPTGALWEKECMEVEDNVESPKRAKLQP